MRLFIINFLILCFLSIPTLSIMYSKKSISKEKYNSKLFIILNLKNSQIKDYLQNQKDNEVFFEKSNIELRKSRSQFQTNLYKQQFDTEELQSLKDKLITIESNRINQKLRYVINIRRILTPNQYKEWLNIRRNPSLLKHYNQKQNPYINK